jgi:hypothetical protein
MKYSGYWRWSSSDGAPVAANAGAKAICAMSSCFMYSIMRGMFVSPFTYVACRSMMGSRPRSRIERSLRRHAAIDAWRGEDSRTVVP